MPLVSVVSSDSMNANKVNKKRDSFFAARDSMKKQIEEVDQHIVALKKEIDIVKEKIQEMPKRSPDDEARQELRARLQVVREHQSKLSEERKNIREAIDGLNISIKKKTDEMNLAREKVPFKSVEDIDRKIAEMEKIIEGQTLPLIEEKKMINEISKLRKSRKTFESFNQQSTIDVEKTRVKGLKTALDEKKVELDQLSARYLAIQEKIKELDSKKDSSTQQMKALLDQRTKLTKNLNDLYDQRKAIQNQILELNEKNRERIEEEKRQRAEFQRIRDVERKIYDLKKSKNQLVDIPPFQKEIEQCDGLITLFQQYVKKDKVASTESHNASSTSNIRQADGASFLPKGVKAAVVLKKEGDLDFYSSMNKKKKEKETVKSTAENSKITLPLPVLAGLSSLQLPVPSTIHDIPFVIAKIEKVKESFHEKVASQIEENKTKVWALEQEIAELQTQITSKAVIDETE